MQKSLNSLFANIFWLIPTWGEGFTYRHLKHQVNLELIDNREDMLTKLQRHLDKTKLSYKQAVTEIMTHDNLEPILDLLGDFILAAISVVIG